MSNPERIGITTSIPVEAIFASGAIPVDLNNIFITSPERRGWVENAEIAGFPPTCCGWIKGIYSAAKSSDISSVVTVMAGDCSNTHALAEIWQHEGLKTIPFAFPYDRSRAALEGEVERLCARLGTDLEAAREAKKQLDPLRELAMEVDRLSWEENRVTGFESHLHQVSASDFCSDPKLYAETLSAFIAEAKGREPFRESVRLGFIGVPTIYDDFYEHLESMGARVVFNETQRQFSLPYVGEDLIDAYLKFTYPYDVFARIADIKREIERRRIDGIIHYVQSFCFRQMEDMLFRKLLGVPVVTIEGDRPMPLDARTKTRLEAFVEMLEVEAL
ncbi:MAG: 2-hydroxyglutaryl-CoA dehydratase [Deltaproteobacteria bacterium]|nr:MAG: 2-hydroxyglutaryl-CoA dehydratase [Deltaproteobacteria bacterium]